MEARALGSLVEKSLTTREQYPLTFNALLNACNQKTSREPVMALDTEALGGAITTLVQKGLVERQQAPGDRVTKFRHNIYKLLDAQDPKLIGLITVLLLRGPQTPGELKGRSERLCEFAGTAEVEAMLLGLCAKSPDPMVARLPRQAGQKETRYRHLFSGGVLPPEAGGTAAAAAPRPAASVTATHRPAETAVPSAVPDDRLARLEKRVEALEALVKNLQDGPKEPAGKDNV